MDIGDFNSDGLMDIYVGTFGNETIAPDTLTARDEILLNRGGLNFERLSNSFLPYSWSHGTSVGDVDNNGTEDVFITGMVGHPSYFVLNNRDSWEVIKTNYTSTDPAIRDGIEDTTIADINLDGYSDLLISGRAQNYSSSFADLRLFPARVYWGAENGITYSYTDLPAPSQVAAWDITCFGSAVGDLNGDGLPDIVMAVTNDGSKVIDNRFYPEWELRNLGLMTQEVATVNGLQILLNNGDNTFRDASTLILNHPNRNIDTFFDLKLYDFNQDGLLDIYGAILDYQKNSAPFIFINDGAGKYVGIGIEGIEDQIIRGMFITDADSDGFPDLAFTSREDFNADGSFRETIEVLLNGSDRQKEKYFGSAHDDFFIMPNSSYYDANAGNDEIIGSLGRDTVAGGFGADIVNGRDGTDTLIFSWAKADYTLTLKKSDSGTIYSRQEGRDTFSEIERLQFTDKSLALDTDGVAGEAYRIYKAAFDRVPDLPGLGYWINDMDGGTSLTTVAAGFIASEEFQNRYGAAVSEVDFITLLYANVLDRTPDQQGLDYWINDMKNGMSRAAVLASFSESDENQRNVAGLIANGIEYTPFIS